MVEATLQRVRAVAPLIREEAAATEAGGRLTDEVVGAMREAGVFRMLASRARGGPQLSPLEQIEVVEELAAADGSAGWCGMINCDGGFLAAFLEPAVADRLYPTLDLPTVVAATPTAQAFVKGDAYVVNGQGTFASGSSHADRFWVNCVVSDENGMRTSEASGMPETRLCLIPKDELEVLDTWHTTGLTGTASNDFQVNGTVVSAEESFNLFEGTAVDPAPLYAWPWTFIIKLGGVPLGIARAALAEAKEVSQTKIVMPMRTLARDDATLQWNIGRAEALYGSARAYLLDVVGRFWDGVCAGRPPTSEEWIDVRLAMTNACTASKEAVTLCYEAMGTTGIFRKSPLDRQLRDVTTLSQHVVSQTKTYANCGRSRLGLDPGGIAFS